jgi:hypothetical protein
MSFLFARRSGVRPGCGALAGGRDAATAAQRPVGGGNRNASGDAPGWTTRTAAISRTLLLLHYHAYDEGQQVLKRLEVRGAAYGNRAAAIAGELAVHFSQGRDDRRAALYHGQAAESALHRSAYREALDHYQRDSHCWRRCPTHPSTSGRNCSCG